MLLDFQKTKKLLQDYKISLCKSELVDSENKAINFAKKNGYPVVLKAFSKDVLHKTDLGLVEVGIKGESDLKKAWQKILKSAKDKKIKIEDILVQEMALDGEIIIGMKRDFQFGPVLMFGLGGIFVEILKDVSFRVCPVSQKEALKMIKEIKGYKTLTGYRGKESANIKKIAELLINLSKLSLERKEIKEIDLNPVIVNKKTALVADAKIIV